MVIESGQSGAFTYLFTNVNANTYIMINSMQKQQQNTFGHLMAVNILYSMLVQLYSKRINNLYYKSHYLVMMKAMLRCKRVNAEET